ncbi:MAG: carboxymuconolactone decarboxylase family protein [Microthrixaceae bacterium]
MGRLRQVPRDEVHDPRVAATYAYIFGDKDPVADPGTDTGSPGDWWTTFAASPDVFAHCLQGFTLYRDPERRLDPVLRELGQTRAGWLRQSNFVYSQHRKSCRGLGMAEEKIDAIATWEISELFSPAERAVLAYTDGLVGDNGRVPDAVFAELQAHLDDEQIVEFTYITAWYAMHADISRALRLEWDDVADPIREIGGGADASDVIEPGPGGGRFRG